MEHLEYFCTKDGRKWSFAGWTDRTKGDDKKTPNVVSCYRTTDAYGWSDTATFGVWNANLEDISTLKHENCLECKNRLVCLINKDAFVVFRGLV